MKTLSQTIQKQEDERARLAKEEEENSNLIYAARQVKPELVKDAEAALEIQKGLLRNAMNPIGIACDTCGTELVNRTPNLITLSAPPCIDVGCAGCGWRGYHRK